MFLLSAAQKTILNMWLEKAASPLHVLHGGFGIGSFIIPLIANPFLAVTEPQPRNSSCQGNLTGITIPTSDTDSADNGPEVVIEDSKMEYAYLIAALIAVVVSFVFYGYHLAGGQERRSQLKRAREEKSDTRILTFKEMVNPATCAGGRFFYGVQVFSLVILYFIQCVGGERVSGKFVRAYAIKHLDVSEDDGSYINTVFWIAFAIGRVLGLITARFISIRLLIMLESGGCLIASILLFIFGGGNATAFWVIIPVLGFFIGPLFPTGAGWANYHVEMTGVGITMFVLGGSAGGLIYMKLTGYLFDHYGYATFLSVTLGFAIGTFVLSAVMNLTGSQHGSRFEMNAGKNETVGVEQSRSPDDEFDNKAFRP